jgi:putative endonuclease
MRHFYVYIMTNASRTLYIGMTNNLERRVWEHKRKKIPGFTSRYNITRLVYVETYPDARSAIAREKQLKGIRRGRKIAMIEDENPCWADLSEEWHES